MEEQRKRFRPVPIVGNFQGESCPPLGEQKWTSSSKTVILKTGYMTH